jgi:5-methylthioadenosine/S-adenosylhomocysteine deaminase
LRSAALAGCTTKTAKDLNRAADRPTGRLPDRGEFVVRGAQILTMDPALGDIGGGDIHVRAGEIIDGRNMIALLVLSCNGEKKL